METHPTKKYRYKTILPLLSCLLLVGCGFHPLYKEGDVSYPLKIATISDRNGQILRNHLLDLLTPEGQPSKPKYTLSVTLMESISDTGINKDATTSRKQATLTATIFLKDQKNKILYTYSTNVINSFATLSTNYYSDLVTEEYSKREGLRLLAEKIKLLVCTYMDNQASTEPRP